MKLYFAFACLLVGASVGAQNLVPNPSFEDYTECPDFWSQTERATGWSAYRQSPDYFNACEPTGYWGVPHNVAGFQNAATGNAYCGMITYALPTVYREHVGAELLAPLEPGVPVNISFRVVSASSDLQVGYVASGFGVLFTMQPYYITDQVPLPDRAALFVDSPITDTVNWMMVSGTYIPDSAYQYIVIGGMFDDALIQVDTFNVNALGGVAWVYVDDVCVSMDLGECLTGNGFDPQRRSSAIRIFPNPVENALFVEGLDAYTSDNAWIEITDILGRQLLPRQELENSTRTMIAMENLPLGSLLIRIRGDNGLIKETLVIHQQH